MAKVRVVVETELKGGARIKVQLNGSSVPRVDGLHTRDVKDGEQSLMWFVLGPPGSSYTLKVTEPASVGYAVGATLDISGRDHGSTWFTT
jgi:beta-glucanase (GH16 family)